MAKSNKQESNNGTPDSAAIISGIETDALAEERQIIQEAENQAAEQRAYTLKKIESILNEAEKEGLEQSEKLKKKILSSVQLEVRRRSLNVRGRILKEIMSRVEKKFQSLIHDIGYKSILVSWIVEAAIGLDAQSSKINASEDELPLIKFDLITEAVEIVRKKTGKNMVLQLTGEQPLKSQGIVLTSDTGRTAYNNQVRTRMLRKERDIRMLIYNTLFTERKAKQ